MPQSAQFFRLNEMLLNLGVVVTPAELQGVLCGRLAGGQSIDEEEWPSLALAFFDDETLVLDEDQLLQLKQLHRVTTRLLADRDFRFSPLLPGDEASITRRTQELGLWCQGFLHGLGQSGMSADAKLSADSADALRDLAQISQVSVDTDDDIEENEVYFNELVEYVKVAVLTVHSEMQGNELSSSSTVH